MLLEGKARKRSFLVACASLAELAEHPLRKRSCCFGPRGGFYGHALGQSNPYTQEVLDFELFRKTLLVVNKKFGLFLRSGSMIEMEATFVLGRFSDPGIFGCLFTWEKIWTGLIQDPH